MSSPKIRIDGVAKAFPSGTSGSATEALDDLTLEVHEGEFLVLIGPTGCGKSTLLRIVAGLLEPDAGAVYLDGRPVEEPDPQKFSLMFQDPLLLPWRTVSDNVKFPLENKQLTEAERRRRVDEYVKLVGLDDFRDFYPHQLSGGMKQRVALARALAVETELLLMDEPLGALDEQTRFILAQELESIWEDLEKTVVFVTHDLDEAIYLADRVVVMTKRPGTIKENFDVGLARPRDIGSERFSDLRSELWDQLEPEAREGLR